MIYESFRRLHDHVAALTDAVQISEFAFLVRPLNNYIHIINSAVNQLIDFLTIIVMVYEYEYDEETQKMRVNCLGGLYGDSIEDYSACMATTIDKLMELKKVVRIVFAGTR